MKDGIKLNSISHPRHNTTDNDFNALMTPKERKAYLEKGVKMGLHYLSNGGEKSMERMKKLRKAGIDVGW